jgi:hypothetical protein
MRAFIVLAVVLSAVVGLVSSGDAEPTAPPPASQIAPPVVPPSPATPPTTTWAAPSPAVAVSPYRPSYSPSYDEIQDLRQQYTRLAGKRAEHMDGPELKQGIVDMQRHFLIAELTALANSADGFDAMRAEIAAAAIMAKDRPELEKLSRDLAKELEAKSTKE